MDDPLVDLVKAMVVAYRREEDETIEDYRMNRLTDIAAIALALLEEERKEAEKDERTLV